MYAEETLAGRFNILGGYINSWNGTNNQGLAIIDCMMNLPVLYKASEITCIERCKYIAMAHADKTMEYHIRPDGSVNHILNYDIHTGELVENRGGQGMYEGSSWSRGQGWAVYGFALSYKHTDLAPFRIFQGNLRFYIPSHQISYHFSDIYTTLYHFNTILVYIF